MTHLHMIIQKGSCVISLYFIVVIITIVVITIIVITIIAVTVIIMLQFLDTPSMV